MSTESFTKQVPIAIAALGHHMHEHALPLPLNVDIDREAETITVRVPDERSQTQWVKTFAIDDEDNQPWMGPVWVKTTWSVRLPDLGVRFRIIGLRRKPASLVGERLLAVVPA